MVRESLPICSAIAAGFRAVFGDVRMVFASESGHTIGQRGPDGVRLADTVVGMMSKKRIWR